MRSVFRHTTVNAGERRVTRNTCGQDRGRESLSFSWSAHAQEQDANCEEAVLDAKKMLPPDQEPVEIARPGAAALQFVATAILVIARHTWVPRLARQVVGRRLGGIHPRMPRRRSAWRTRCYHTLSASSADNPSASRSQADLV